MTGILQCYTIHNISITKYLRLHNPCELIKGITIAITLLLQFIFIGWIQLISLNFPCSTLPSLFLFISVAIIDIKGCNFLSWTKPKSKLWLPFLFTVQWSITIKNALRIMLLFLFFSKGTQRKCLQIFLKLLGKGLGGGGGAKNS